jgi:ribosomal protein S18 acetylase RimI-like enzyme
VDNVHGAPTEVMAAPQVTLFDEAVAVLDEAGAFLAGRPAEHNLIHTLLQQRAATGEPGRYWLVRDGATPTGLVLQSPIGFRAALTPMVAEAARAAVEAIAGDGIDLPGVEGEAAAASAFAGHWTEVCRTGARPVLGMRLQLLGRLVLPEGVAGRYRQATEADRPVVREWFSAFSDEVSGTHAPDDAVDRRIGAGLVGLWELDGEIVSLAGRTDAVTGTARIGPVYSPPERRRLGYAGACVGHMAARIVDAGDSCVLYTDLENPTSNSVYRQLGFATIGENVRYEFAPRPEK